ncbi:heavy metal translocating P-type ATPase [Listeria sp. PSOL-1]|uniref:heavy metal translocating P-type ATPase n=1 Tax=Listeria sp. PSOL-1 TaxID=1844999 RepID=UPI0013D5BCCC|nr:heavy metal translocating P-type ATPase [Listeria sp. PSOL-1]
MIPMSASETVQKAFFLKGLDCANCAMKVENGVKGIKGVVTCNVNFATTTLVADVDVESEESVQEAIIAKIKQIEPEVTVEDKNTKKNEHNHEHASIKKMLICIAISSIFLFAGLFIPLPVAMKIVLFVVAYLIIGGEVLYRAIRNITRGQVFDENFLMAIATIGAFAIGQYPEGVAVMLFYQIGEFFQSLAVNKSRKSISELMDIRPDYAFIKRGANFVEVSPEEVSVGDTIRVRPGEKIPLDGSIIDGKSMVDTSALTGESVPRKVTTGSEVLGGFINTNGVLIIAVTKNYAESTVSKILDLVENASNRKAPTENFITKFARYYTPAVVIIALLLAVIPPLVFSLETFSDWIYRALVFLVISCPCALVVSIPLGFFAGIGASSKKGILVKGSNYLEALNDVKYVVFDKTGTLTKGIFEVTKIVPAEGFSSEEISEYAAIAEVHSNHPIATSIKKAYGKTIADERIADYEEVSGHGIKANIDGKQVLVGNIKLMQQGEFQVDAPETSGTIVYVAIDQKFAGYLIISDEVKDDAKGAITALKKLNIKKTVMLTGDARAVGQEVAKNLSVDEVYSELLPQDKVTQVEKIMEQAHSREKVAFVGDGINDTPVLARSDVGIAMGGLGSDAAIEAADIVIMTDEPSRIATSINIAKRTRKVVWQNIIFALVVKGIFLTLGAFGFATMWEAVFSDVGVTLLAVLNSTRILQVKNLD